jgi:hypothetical protein
MAKSTEGTSLSELLEEAREQMDLLMDVSNFAFFLLDPDSKELDIRLLYERGNCCKDTPDPSRMGIERFLMARRDNTIFWPIDVHEQLRKNKIDMGGEIPTSCIGVQLHVGEKIIGGITVKRYGSEEQFNRHDHMLLSAVANQIVGAIEIRNRSEFRENMTKLDNRSHRQLSVFLCHSKKDKEKVQELYDLLSVQPGIDPWFDQVKLLPGVNWDLEIAKAVKSADVVIVCLSKKSLTKDGYVHKEIKLALDIAERKPEGTIYIIPVKLEDCDLPARLDQWQWVEYFRNSQEGFDKIMLALRERAKSFP